MLAIGYIFLPDSKCSGDCSILPVTWTIQVPAGDQILLTLSHVYQSCPSTHLDIRDGVDEDNILLYQVRGNTNNTVSLASNINVVRLELRSDRRETNMTQCFAQFLASVTHTGTWYL